MDRRDFIRLGVAGAGASLIAPSQVLAGSDKQVTADIYYTKESPGRWSAKVATHLPNIEIEKAGGKVTVKVVTAHEMKDYEHYIVKHVLLDQNYKFIDEHLFDPDQGEEPRCQPYTLHDYSGPLYALSMCNKHDLWLASATV